MFSNFGIKIKEGLTFDDVLLTPKHSNIVSRSHVDLTVEVNDHEFSNPIIPANMKSIVGKQMLDSIFDYGGLGILHRFLPFEEQLQIVDYFIEVGGRITPFNHIGFSIGVQEEDKHRVSKLVDKGVQIFCIDIAHGDSDSAINMTKFIRQLDKNITIIAGNVATADGAALLWKAGADIVKVGVGGGSLCTTRIETGNGVPQLTALIDVYGAKENWEQILGKNLYIIGDGGIKNAGDMVKALCFCDMIMAGNVFAGCSETPGKVLCIGDNTYKEYVGSSTHKTNYVEGVSALVPAKGSFSVVLQKMLEGIRSGCSYQGVSNLEDLRKNPEFVKITNSGLIESKPHNIIMV